jgi:dUTP pyrophosphatase
VAVNGSAAVGKVLARIPRARRTRYLESSQCPLDWGTCWAAYCSRLGRSSKGGRWLSVKRVAVRVRRIRRSGTPLPLPKYETPGSSGLDLRSDRALTIPAGRTVVLETGIAVEIPRGYEGQIRGRSGLAARRGIMCLNSPGTIDSDYRGELAVVLVNLSNRPSRVRRGDRIAQLVIAPVVQVRLEELAERAHRSGGRASRKPYPTTRQRRR